MPDGAIEMAEIPTTSTTLLRDIAHDSQHARWSEFVARYRPMMEAFLRERFPTLEADDIIQDTLVAVCAALPFYRYVPDEKGLFHNYLTGILRNKALRQFHKDQRQAEIAEELRRSRGDAPYQSADSGRADAPRPPPRPHTRQFKPQSGPAFQKRGRGLCPSFLSREQNRGKRKEPVWRSEQVRSSRNG